MRPLLLSLLAACAPVNPDLGKGGVSATPGGADDTGEAVDTAVPDRAPRKSRKQLEKEAGAAVEAEAGAAEDSGDDDGGDE